MKMIDALNHADRHCDQEGLPPASPEAKRLDSELTAGSVQPVDAVRRLVEHYAVDMPELIPNATTIAAMKEARQGGLPRFASFQALMDDLNADD